MRSVEQVRIGGGFEGGDRPGHVALVPAQDIGQDFGLIHLGAGGRELQGAAAGALLWGRGYQNLDLRVRKYDGADIAAVEHRARRGTAKLPLEGQKRGPHVGNG